MASLTVQSSICPVMVGRDDAVQWLSDRFVQAQQGAGQVALITGEAGIGKSRLIRALRDRFAAASPLVMHGMCFETDHGLPYAPVAGLLRAHLESRTTEERGRILAQSPDVLRLLPDLDETHVSNPSTDSDGDPEKRRLHQALLDVLLTPVETAARLVIVEDLHWSDEASLEFLLLLARKVTANRALLILTYRDEAIRPPLAQFLASLSRERLTQEIHLLPLSLASVQLMIDAIFAEEFAARDKFTDAIHNLSEGNPFVIEEMLKALVASGDIYLTDNQWKSKPLFEQHIPRTLQVNLSQRLGRVTPAAREILSLAAVAGRQFDFGLLQQLSGLPESALLRILRELRDAQLVTEESADRYTFRHALTRQAIYSDLLLRERRNLHRRMGEALERLYPDDPAHLGDIADHYYYGEVWARAAQYAQRAGEWAVRLYAPLASLEFYARAVEAHQKDRQTVPPALLRARGQLYERTGNFEAARDDYTAMIAAAQANNDKHAEWQGWSDLGWLWTERDFARAGEYFAHVLQMAPAMQATPLLVSTLNRVGNWNLHSDQIDQGLQYHERALAIAEQLGDRRGQSESLDLLGLSCYYVGQIATGTAYYERCVALFRELDDLPGLSASLSVHAMRGASYNLDTFACLPVGLNLCLHESEEAVEAARKIGWRAGEASALIYCGFSLGPRGQFQRALDATNLGLTIATEIEHNQWQGAAHLVLGSIYRDMYAFEAARSHHEAVFAIVQDLHAPLLLRMVAGHLATTCIASGALDRAAQVLDQILSRDLPMISVGQRLLWCASAELALARREPEQALNIVDRLITTTLSIRTVDSSLTIPRLSHLKGEAHRMLGQKSAAERALLEATEAADRLGMLPLRSRILTSLGKCFQGQGRHNRADDAFLAADQVIQQVAGQIDDRVLRQGFTSEAERRIRETFNPSPQRTTKQKYDGLTTREREIATLITEGKSNRAIAEALILSDRTVAKHIENILSKLGFTSRAQIAAWAVEHKLSVLNQ
jgi:DNA-binding CsgD family transcriptional regulator